MNAFLLLRGAWLARRVLLALAVLAVAWPAALVVRSFEAGPLGTALAAIATAAAVFALGAVLVVARRARLHTLAPTLAALAVAGAWTPVVALGSVGLAWAWSFLFGASFAWALASGAVALARAGRDRFAVDGRAREVMR